MSLSDQPLLLNDEQGQQLDIRVSNVRNDVLFLVLSLRPELGFTADEQSQRTLAKWLLARMSPAERLEVIAELADGPGNAKGG